VARVAEAEAREASRTALRSSLPAFSIAIKARAIASQTSAQVGTTLRENLGLTCCVFDTGH
jgi:hypothetical protein